MTSSHLCLECGQQSSLQSLLTTVVFFRVLVSAQRGQIKIKGTSLCWFWSMVYFLSAERLDTPQPCPQCPPSPLSSINNPSELIFGWTPSVSSMGLERPLVGRSIASGWKKKKSGVVSVGWCNSPCLVGWTTSRSNVPVQCKSVGFFQKKKKKVSF